MYATKPLRVAVVDDDAPTLQMICSMLQELGYEGIPFENAAALAAARRAQVFHALVLDLSMPDMDGFELIHQLVQKLPVEPVIISSNLSHAVRHAARLVCQGRGITVLGVLSKPYACGELDLLLAPPTPTRAS